MPTNTPRLGLPKGNGSDNARDYLKGAIAGGGLWHALEVLDDAVLQSSVSTLNDVTLTSPNIGAAEWTDAQHTHASAATAGSTLGPGTTLSTPTLQTPAVSGVMTFGGDATLQRTGAGALRADTNLGVGVAPAAWRSDLRVVQLGGGSALMDANAAAYLLSNSYYDAAGQKAFVTGAASQLLLGAGTLQVTTAPSVAAGAAQTFTQRLHVSEAGTLTLSPAGGQAALRWSAGNGSLDESATNVLVEALGAKWLLLGAAGTVVAPKTHNTLALGWSGQMWTAVYATNGTIQTSAAEAKQAITPLDPAAALAAVLATDPVTFTYTAPAPTAEQYELPDDPEQAEQVLHQRLVNAPLQAAARSQAGFVLQDATGTYQTDPLFETGSGQSNAANSVGIALAAIHELNRRLTAGGL